MTNPTRTTTRTPDHTARLLDAARTIERLRDELDRERARAAEPLAVVGMALRMPGGADTPAAFWRLLEAGVDAVGPFPAERGDAAAVTHPDPDHPGTAYVTRGAFLDRVDGFDPGVFGIAPRDAVGMDPQQRLVLELAWEGLERAGYAPDGLVDSATGVFLGVSTTDYVRLRQELGDPKDVDHYQLLGEPSFVAGRVSHVLGLQGPSQVVDTTCSSSLVALDGAVRALRGRRCDLALAGGVNLMLSPYGFLLMSKFRALAPDGRCKTFDEAADGYVRGEGAGLVVLKRLSDAVAAGDHIRGVVLGSAVNHDGASSGLTVPNGAAQQRVLRAALADGGVDPGDVDLVEAHGTGTSLGDPIELRALEAVYGTVRPAGDPLLVGSVKTNIGHLEPAAGIAGVVKALLALEHGTVPPHLHLEQASSRVPWATMHLDVPTRPRPWPRRDRPRRAAVSSFGASGTNAHVVLGGPVEDDDPLPRPAAPRAEAILVSARTPSARAQLAARYAGHLRTSADALADVAFTSQVGRARLGEGAVVVATDRDEAIARLDALAAGAADAPLTLERRGSRLQHAAWLLPGQGAQSLGMAGRLRAVPAFARPLEEALAQLDPVGGIRVDDIVWGASDARAVDDTAVAQPALFAVSYALGSMLLELGVRRPAALLGHSVGELAAACLGGALDLPDAARLVSARGRLMSALPAGGTMVALSCPEDVLRAAIEPGEVVAVAAVNGPTDVVASGAEADVERVMARLRADGVRAQQLRVSHAFHSPLLEPALAELAEVAASVTLRAPSIPIVSNVTGSWWDETCLAADYWVRHAASTVRFGDGVRLLHDEGLRTFVELGAHPVLVPMARRAIEDDETSWIGTLRRGQDDLAALQEALGRLDLEGGRVDWQTLHAGRRMRRVELPTYPWERERFWFRERTGEQRSGAAVAGLGQRVPGAGEAFAEELDAAPDTSLGWVVERAVRAARATGVAWAELGPAWAGAPVGPGADAPWSVQAAVRDDDGGARVELSGAAAAQRAAGAAWIPHGSVALRGAGSGGDGAAWGALVTRVAEELAAELGPAGRLAGVEGATCSDPAAVTSRAVTLREKTDAATIADVALLAADGSTVGEVTGAAWTAAASQTPWYPASDVLLELRWEEAANAPDSRLPAAVRLCGGDDRLGAALEAALAGRGLAVSRASVPPAPQDIAAGELVVLLAPTAAPAAGDLVRSDLRAHGLDHELALCVLVAALDERGADARVALLTRGSAATPNQQIHAPLGATLHGLGRVLALEHPAAWGGIVDLDPDGEDDVATVADAIVGLAADDEQAIRGTRRLAARIVERGDRPLPAAARLHRPGTVLVTGGLGGIGVPLCRRLARGGTERLVLLVRSALPPEADWPALAADDPQRARADTVRGLRALGAQVEVQAADVADEAAVGTLVARLIADDELPLRGVIHAAGVSGPQFARDVDPETYAAVWSPKVEGAWALHQATRDADLDLFVCFSSVAASWGSQHLASYSAANAFLEALAGARRAEGLPALTVAWGTWALDSGLFGADVLEFMESIGLRQLAPDQCLELLARLQACGATNAIVCAADWSTYRAVMEARRERPRLARMHVEDEAGGGGDDEELLRALAAADATGRDALLLQAVVRAVEEVLELDGSGIDPEEDVFARGIDSLMVMELVGRLRRALGVELRPSELFERASVREWAQILAGRLSGDGPAAAEHAPSHWESAAALAVDAVLDADVVPGPPVPPPTGRLEDVVLTGATGFVGAFVLRDLLARGARRVRCLVRAPTPHDGWRRIADNAGRYLKLPADAEARVDVVCGDLGAAQLGLGSEAALRAFVGGADGVLHVAAHVHFAHPYERMRAANVAGTEALLRSCAQAGVPLHHVSTYGIWGMPVDGRDTIAEDDDIATAGRLVTGYVQSKWAAEQLVRQAADRGVAVSCHRLGRVLGDAGTGAALTSHFTLGVIKGCLQLGAAPALDLDVEMTPVDYISAALVELAATRPADGTTYHLVNRRHMAFATLVEHLRARGWALETLDPAAWYTRLESSLAAGEENALHTVMGTVRELVVGGERAIDYDDARARAALAPSSITCPPLDERLLTTYLDRLLADGFLPPPTTV
jgi:thioester reductase-like protein